MVLEQLPADAGALTVLGAALAWALSELRAHRKHRAQIDRERVDLEAERLELEARRVDATEALEEKADRRAEALEGQERAQRQIAAELTGGGDGRARR